MITWQKAPSCGSSQCIEVGQDLATEGGLVYLKSAVGPMMFSTREEFEAFRDQCKNGEWDHIR